MQWAGKSTNPSLRGVRSTPWQSSRTAPKSSGLLHYVRNDRNPSLRGRFLPNLPACIDTSNRSTFTPPKSLFINVKGILRSTLFRSE